MRLTLKTGPAAEPLELDEAKSHVRVTSADEDDLITSLIPSARAHVETITGRALISQTWIAKLDAFPCNDDGRIVLPRPPLQSVASVKYVDVNGTLVTLATSDYQVVLGGEFDFGYILPSYGNSWPSVREEPDSVVVEFECGYGDAAADVRKPVTQYIKLLIGSMYLHRESTAAEAAQEIGFARSLIADYCMVG